MRHDVLERAGALIVERKDELGKLLAREEGKTIAEAVGETVRASQVFKFFAGEALRNTGDAVASVRPGIDVMIEREAVGVIGLITPWNFPCLETVTPANVKQPPCRDRPTRPERERDRRSRWRGRGEARTGAGSTRGSA